MSAHPGHGSPMALEPPVRRHARRVFAAILVPAFLATVVGAWLLWPHGEQPTLRTAAPGTTFEVVTLTAVDVTTERVEAARGDGEPIEVNVPRSTCRSSVRATGCG
ncbi:hypothetical protein [Cellulomonas soli]